MKLSDEMLQAYFDGELDLVARAEIEAALARDPGLARIAERHRSSRAPLWAAAQPRAEPAAPAHRAQAAAEPAAPAHRAQAAAEPATPAARRQLPQWAAPAAALALGLFVGAFALRGPEWPYAESDAGLIAHGELAWALTGQLASDAGTGTVRIGLSFRDRSGVYCRTFRLQQKAPLAGLACRLGEDWQLQLLAAAAPEEGDQRDGAAMPMAVLLAVDAAIDGEPLDAAAEVAVRNAGWPVPERQAIQK